MLGIPTTLDRLIQQALLQVLTPLFDPTYSDSSFGFRPGRSTHQALDRAKEHIAAGHRWVVDMDLEKFLDRVNHDGTAESLIAATKGALQGAVDTGVRMLLAVKALQTRAVDTVARELDEGFLTLVDVVEDFSAATRLMRSAGLPGCASRISLADIDRDIESLDHLTGAADSDNSGGLSPEDRVFVRERAHLHEQEEPAAPVDGTPSANRPRSQTSPSAGSHGRNAGVGLLLMFLLSGLISALRHVPQWNRANKPQWLPEQRRDASQLLDRRGTAADHSCLAALLNNRSNALSKLGRHEEAVGLLSQAVGLQRVALEREPDNDTYRTFLQNHLTNQLRSYLELKRWKEAAEAAQQSCAVSSQDERELYESACRLARVATAIQDGAAEGELRTELVEQLVLQATQLLEEARRPDVRIEDEIRQNAALKILKSSLPDTRRSGK